jgi:hypothetical protein
MYVELINQYSRQMHGVRLKLTPDTVLNQLAMISMASIVTDRLAKQMNKNYKSYFSLGTVANTDGGCLTKTTDHKKKKGDLANQTNTRASGVARTPQNQKEGMQTHKSEGKPIDKVIATGIVMSILNISKSTVKRWRDTGKIPYSRPHPEANCKYMQSEIEALARTMKNHKSND